MNKYLRAISTNFVFLAISAVFFLAITPVAIRTMGEEFYGLWAMLNAWMIFSNIGNLGIDAIVMKLSSESPNDNNSERQSNRIMSAGYLIVLTMSVITALVLLLIRNVISDNINVSLELRDQFRHAIEWLAAGIVPQFLARVPQGFLLSQLRNRAVRQIELFSSISIWLGAVVIAMISRDLVAIAAWCFLSNIFVLGSYLWVLSRHISFQFQLDVSTLRQMVNFSGFLFLESLAISLFQHFDKVIVGLTLGPAIAGVYSVGTSLALRLSMVTGQATEVMIPYASLQESLGDQQKLFVIFRQLSRYVSLILAGLSSLLIIWMNEILSVWITPDYARLYANAFRILIIAYSWLSLSRPAHQTLTGMGKVKLTAIIYLSSSILMLGVLFLLSREFDMLGAVSSNLVLTFLLVFNLVLYFMFEGQIQWKHVVADLQWGLFLPILFLGLGLFSTKSILLYKSVETIVLVFLLLWAIARDNLTLIKGRLIQVKHSVSKT